MNNNWVDAKYNDLATKKYQVYHFACTNDQWSLSFKHTSCTTTDMLWHAWQTKDMKCTIVCIYVLRSTFDTY